MHRDSHSLPKSHCYLTVRGERDPLRSQETALRGVRKQGCLQALAVEQKPKLTAEQVQALDLFKQGKSLREIVRDIHDVSSGSKYNRFLGELQQLIRGQI